MEVWGRAGVIAPAPPKATAVDDRRHLRMPCVHWQRLNSFECGDRRTERMIQTIWLMIGYSYEHSLSPVETAGCTISDYLM